MGEPSRLHYKLPQRTASLLLKSAIIGSLILFPAKLAAEPAKSKPKKEISQTKPVESPAFRALSDLVFCTSEKNIQKLVAAFPRDAQAAELLKKEMSFYTGFPYEDGFTSSPEIMARHVADIVTRLKNGEPIPSEFVPRDSRHAYYKGPDRNFLAIIKVMNQVRLYGRMPSAADREEMNNSLRIQFKLADKTDVMRLVFNSKDAVELSKWLKTDIATAQSVIDASYRLLPKTDACK